MKHPRIPKIRRPKIARKARAAFLEISGVLAIVAGVALIYVPAAVILAGGALVAGALALDRPTPPGPE